MLHEEGLAAEGPSQGSLAERPTYRGVWTTQVRYDFIRQPELSTSSRLGTKRTDYPLSENPPIPSLPNLPVSETPRSQVRLSCLRCVPASRSGESSSMRAPTRPRRRTSLFASEGRAVSPRILQITYPERSSRTRSQGSTEGTSASLCGPDLRKAAFSARQTASPSMTMRRQSSNVMSIHSRIPCRPGESSVE
jgi:hypothetical protein